MYRDARIHELHIPFCFSSQPCVIRYHFYISVILIIQHNVKLKKKKTKRIVFQRRKMRSFLSPRQAFLKTRGFELNPHKNVSGGSCAADR